MEVNYKMAVMLNTLEQVIPSPQNGDAWGITVIGDEMFVGGWWSRLKRLQVYDLKTYVFKRTLTTPEYSYAIGTDGVNLYIKNPSKQIVKIDKNTGAAISTNTNVTFNMGDSGSFKIDINNDRLYACDYSNKLNIFTYSTGNLIKSYTLPTAYTAGVEVIENKYIIVSCYTTNKIYISPIIDNDITNLSFTELYVSTTRTVGIAYSNNPTAKLIVGSYDSGIYSGNIEGLSNIKYLIKQNNQYYTIKSEFYDELIHDFTPLTLNGGLIPNTIDINAFGFEDLLNASTIMNKNNDIFKPLDKLSNNFILNRYKAK